MRLKQLRTHFHPRSLLNPFEFASHVGCHKLVTFYRTFVGTFESVIIAGDDFKTVTIAPRTTQGFYITLQSPFLLYRTTSLEVGSTYIRNDDIVVSVGIGIGEYPLRSTSAFYNSRGFYGKVLYGFKSKCSVETTATYNFVVYYPKAWEGDDVFQEVAFIVKKHVLDMINSDEDFQEHSEADELEFTSVLPYVDTSGSCKSPCDEYHQPSDSAPVYFHF